MGTHIRMADGSEKPIEEVRLLDQVLTAERNAGRVVSAEVRDEPECLVKIGTWGHNHLRIPRTQSVLTKRGYVLAEELTSADRVAFPRFFGSGLDSIHTADLISEPSLRLVKSNRWLGLPGRKGLRTDANPIPEEIQLTESTGRLIGLFLAEGNVDSSKIRWTYGTHESETLVPETVELLNKAWGVPGHVQPRTNNSTYVTVYGTGWARLFRNLCGDHVGHKMPYPALMSGPRDFQDGMLEGWLAGDGWRGYYDRRCGVSISHGLTLAMYDIAQALGYRPVIDNRASTQNRYAKFRQPRWTLSISTKDSNNYSTQDDSYVWRKVRKLEFEAFEGPFYSFGVEGDNSYVAEGVGMRGYCA